MPLVIISGHPCIGKTRFSQDLKAYLESIHACSVVLINEESLGITPAAGYSSSFTEKSTRGSLKSAVDHNLSSTAWVIVDSLNYIKGFRYELYCLARTIKSTHCCVWLSCDEATSNSWSLARKDVPGGTYPQDILEDLRRRFEPPNERNRWDRPLFSASTSPASAMEPFPAAMGSSTLPEASPGSASGPAEAEAGAEAPAAMAAADTLGELVISSSFRRKGKSSSGASVASTFRRAAERAADPSSVSGALVFNRFDAIVASSAHSARAARPGTASVAGQAENHPAAVANTAAAVPALTAAEQRVDLFFNIYTELSAAVAALPNSSTVKIQHGNADILYELDHVSQLITHAIAAHQSGPDMQDGAPLLLPAYGRSLELHRTVSLAELQRHRTQFVRLNSKHPPADGTQAGSMFVDFLAVQL